MRVPFSSDDPHEKAQPKQCSILKTKPSGPRTNKHKVPVKFYGTLEYSTEAHGDIQAPTHVSDEPKGETTDDTHSKPSRRPGRPRNPPRTGKPGRPRKTANMIKSHYANIAACFFLATSISSTTIFDTGKGIFSSPGTSPAPHTASNTIEEVFSPPHHPTSQALEHIRIQQEYVNALEDSQDNDSSFVPQAVIGH